MSRGTPRAKKIYAERRALCETCEYWKIIPGETYVPICVLWWEGFNDHFFKKGARCKNFMGRSSDLILRFEDQHPNCQEKSCGNAPLGCAVKRYCPKEEV